jgi:hypothetical protein
MWLISFARYAPQQQLVKGAMIEVPRAHFVASLRFLAQRFRWAPAKVRRFLAELERDGTLRTVRETPGGTLYHLVNYELYQLGRVGAETTDSSLSDTHASQRRDGGQTKRRKGSTASKESSTLFAAPSPGSSISEASRLPKLTMDAIYESWVARIGTVNYGRLRKAVQPIYESVVAIPSTAAVIRALEAFSESRDADRPQYRSTWTPEKFGADLHSWIRIGAMELLDEYGAPTERGIASGIFDS